MQVLAVFFTFSYYVFLPSHPLPIPLISYSFVFFPDHLCAFSANSSGCLYQTKQEQVSPCSTLQANLLGITFPQTLVWLLTQHSKCHRKGDIFWKRKRVKNHVTTPFTQGWQRMKWKTSKTDLLPPDWHNPIIFDRQYSTVQLNLPYRKNVISTSFKYWLLNMEKLEVIWIRLQST